MPTKRILIVLLLLIQRTIQLETSSPRRAVTAPFPNGPNDGQLFNIKAPQPDSKAIEGRDFTVWIPPSYNKEQRHPVLYVYDGQNAMEDRLSWTGSSWRLIGALTRLEEHGFLKTLPIVVLLPSASDDFLPGIRRRHLEYGDYNLFFAQAHAEYVAKTIKPLIDARFHTKPLKSFVIGSSLGGQAGFHLVLRYPALFSGAAALSPYFGPAIIEEVRQNGGSKLKDKRLYMDVGGDSDQVTVPLIDIQDHMTATNFWNPGYFFLDTSLKSSCYAMQESLNRHDEVNIQFELYPGARHNERAWSKRIDRPLLHLLEGNE